MLYVRYQDYASEIGSKDQLIQQNTVQLNTINKEIVSKTERLKKLQTELSSEQSRFTTFEFANRQRALEAEMQLEHYE